MPYMQTALTAMNTAFGAEAIDESYGDAAELFGPQADNSLSDALRRMPRLELSDAVSAYIDTWPGALQAALKAAIHHNVTRDVRVPITFAWTPAYDFSITIYDVVDTASSRGGITILLTSRYPDDVHPLHSGS